MRTSANGTTRRRFLGAAAGVTGAAVVAAIDPGRANAATIAKDPASASAASNRFVGAALGLETGTTAQANLKEADGGDTYSDVVTVRSSEDPVKHKHIGQPKYEVSSVRASLDTGLDYATWIVDTANFAHPRRSGAIVSADINGAVKARRQFTNALITEIKIPALDAASKDAGFLKVTWRPEHAADGSAKGTFAFASKQKPWTEASFRLEIDGLDCTKVARIEEITITQAVLEVRDGESRFPTLTAGDVDFSDLVVTIAASGLSTWQQWFDDFVVKGNSTSSNEKNGTLTFLTSDLKTELGVLQLHHMGIYRLDPDNEPTTTHEGISRGKASLYVDQMNFTKLGPYALT